LGTVGIVLLLCRAYSTSNRMLGWTRNLTAGQKKIWMVGGSVVVIGSIFKVRGCWAVCGYVILTLIRISVGSIHISILHED
jgi:hypothetical protein